VSGWDGGPEGVQEERQSGQAQARHRRVVREMMRLLVGAGAMPVLIRNGTGWDIEGLPLGGKVKATAAKDAESKARLLRWMRSRAMRRTWGALAALNWGPGTGLSVQMSAEDFAHIVGQLALLEREKEAWLDGTSNDPVERQRRR
jgi:hypothetical protein